MCIIRQKNHFQLKRRIIFYFKKASLILKIHNYLLLFAKLYFFEEIYKLYQEILNFLHLNDNYIFFFKFLNYTIIFKLRQKTLLIIHYELFLFIIVKHKYDLYYYYLRKIFN